MNKKAQTKTKSKEADVLKLEVLLNKLPKNVTVKETSKGHILRNGKHGYLMHVKQSPLGILHFVRTETGKHLQSGYIKKESDIELFLKEIETKIKDQVIDEKIEKVGKQKPTSPSPSIKVKK